MALRDQRHPAKPDTPVEPRQPSLAIAPFTPQEARQHQKAWADYLGVPVEYENALGMTFMLIPPGKFLMGDL